MQFDTFELGFVPISQESWLIEHTRVLASCVVLKFEAVLAVSLLEPCSDADEWVQQVASKVVVAVWSDHGEVAES